ncbi:MAG TPA: hypothetical protein VKE50_06130 [Thermoanaerobaculia bacterium]|nr:hypothetical protein [Thermoanaerobaculia bacterium]
MTALRERPVLAALLLGMAFEAAGQERVPPPRTEPGPAPMVPAALADLPRLPISDAAAPPPQPLIVHLRSDAGVAACYDLRFRATGPETVVLPVPGSDRRVTLVELAFDPARRARHLFYDAGPESRGPILSASAETSGVLSFGFGQMELGGDADPDCAKMTGGAPMGVNRPWHEGDGPNAGSVLARVEVLENSDRPVWGWCLAEGAGGASTHSAIRSPSGGARQEWSVASYVTAGGDAIAIVLALCADWTDPRDGKVYRYFQYASGGFAPLKKEAQPVLRLPAGAAAPRPIELVVYSEEEWPGCASRAAERR